MGRFTRRSAAGPRWVSRLRDGFSMGDLQAAAPEGDLAGALSWLYEAIERGRLEPVRTDDGELRYRFAGRRRAEDRQLEPEDVR